MVIIIYYLFDNRKESFYEQENLFGTTPDYFWKNPNLRTGEKTHVTIYPPGNITYVSGTPPKSNRTKYCHQKRCPYDYGDMVNCWSCHHLK